jgi:hypothetical protein
MSIFRSSHTIVLNVAINVLQCPSFNHSEHILLPSLGQPAFTSIDKHKSYKHLIYSYSALSDYTQTYNEIKAKS